MFDNSFLSAPNICCAVLYCIVLYCIVLYCKHQHQTKVLVIFYIIILYTEMSPTKTSNFLWEHVTLLTFHKDYSIISKNKLSSHVQ